LEVFILRDVGTRTSGGGPDARRVADSAASAGGRAPAGRTRARRWLLGAAAVLLLLPVVAAIAAAAAIAIGVTIDASRWRGALAERASEAVGRPVLLEGQLEIVLARESSLRIGALRIPNAAGFSAPDFATLGEARARIDLLALLERRLDVRELVATDARIHLERAADGRANWAFQAPARPAAQGSRARVPFTIEIERTTIRSIGLEYHDARSGSRRAIDLDELVGTGSWSAPVAIDARGRVAHAFPYRIGLAGGSARLLAEAGEDWPFAVELEVLGTRLHAAGTLDTRAREARFDFGAGTEDLEQVERFAATTLPKFGRAALSGRGVARADAVALDDLRGVLGAAEVTGRLAVAFGGARPRVTGELAMAELDLRPFLRDAGRGAERPLAFDDLADDPTPLRGLVPVDLALALRIGRWVGVPVDVRAAAMELTADERGVRAPLSVTVADVPLAGRIELETGGTVPGAVVALGGRRSPLGDLVGQFTGIDGVQGALERIDVSLRGRGETLGELVRDLELRLEATGARLSYGNAADGRPVGFTLDALALDAARGKPLRGSARGALLGEPATFRLRAGPLSDTLRSGSSPIALELATAGANARIEGTLAGGARNSALAFRLDAPRSGALARWFGVAPKSTLPVSIAGAVRLEPGAWHLDETTLRLGRSTLTVDVHRAGARGGRQAAIVSVRSPLVDVPELETLRPASAGAAATARRLSVDLPILPRGIDFADADVGIGIERVILGRAALSDIGFGARVREGRLPPSPFAARLADVPFQGLLGIDLRSADPEVTLDMSTGAVDLGALLGALGAVDGIEARADALQVSLAGRGARPSELARRSSFEARMKGGNLSLSGPGGRIAARVALREAVVGAAPGEPVTAALDGSLDGTPVEIRAASGTLADFARDATRVPFSAQARAAGATLAVEGEAALPLGRGGRLALDLRGERLDSLGALARAQLPPWGPWSLRGPIVATATGYEVPQLELQVGESRLTGRGSLDVTGVRPRLDLRVTAPHVQLDDFELPPRPDPGNRSAADAQALRAQASGAATQAQKALAAPFLRRFDARVDIEVRQVLSGRDRLADGTLRAQLVDGRLSVGPAELYLPGGTAKLAITYDPTRGGVELAVGAYVERFEYGILARRRRPDSDFEGLFSMGLELTGKAPSLDAVMASADGRIDLAVWPRNLGAGQFDLWVVNLLRELLPVLDRGRVSVVNCAVGRFDLAGGRLTRDALVIDTSRMRVLGAGEIDFATEAIDFKFQPRAKGAQLFSLETPVRVTGTLSDFDVGVSPGDVLASIGRFFASMIVVPLETLFRGPLPRDGADVCTDPLRTLGDARR
jgi:uncharacterized protein involved in outer membrane biogenesis